MNTPTLAIQLGTWIVLENETGAVRLITDSTRQVSIFMLGRQMSHYTVMQARPLNMEEMIEQTHCEIGALEEYLDDHSVIIMG